MGGQSADYWRSDFQSHHELNAFGHCKLSKSRFSRQDSLIDQVMIYLAFHVSYREKYSNRRYGQHSILSKRKSLKKQMAQANF